MVITINAISDVKMQSLSDLYKLKPFMEANNLKINISQIARELDVDRRTVLKRINGFVPKTTRNKPSKIDQYYDLIYELIYNSTQRFFYKKNLWQYLVDNHDFKIPQSSFRRWISKHDEFQSYFNGITNRTVNGVKRDCTTTHHKTHHETGPGYEAQIDYKESMNFMLKDGTITLINVFSMVLSYSRYKIYQITLKKTQDILFHLLDHSFATIGGVPKTLKTDNMKTIMDVARTNYTNGHINARFEQFAKDYGFKVKPCKAANPETKSKVESPMKLLDELYAYNGIVDYSELCEIVRRTNNRENYKIHPTTYKIPVEMLENEKNSLSSLPNDKIRNQYKLITKNVKVNKQSMICYKQKYYSVPAKYINVNLTYQVYDNYLYIYDNTKLVAIHEIKDNVKYNYLQEHMEELTKLSINVDEDTIKAIAINNMREIGELYK